MISTLYHLFIPMALFKLYERKLALIDFELDPFIANLYFLTKGLYYTFTHDYTIANLEERPIRYDPDKSEYKYHRQE